MNLQSKGFGTQKNRDEKCRFFESNFTFEGSGAIEKNIPDYGWLNLQDVELVMLF